MLDECVRLFSELREHGSDVRDGADQNVPGPVQAVDTFSEGLAPALFRGDAGHAGSEKRIDRIG